MLLSFPDSFLSDLTHDFVSYLAAEQELLYDTYLADTLNYSL
jgi:hypothetical protein